VKERCIPVHVVIAAKALRFRLNQNQTDQCIAEIVYQNIALAVVEDIKLNLFKAV